MTCAACVFIDMKLLAERPVTSIQSSHQRRKTRLLNAQPNHMRGVVFGSRSSQAAFPHAIAFLAAKYPGESKLAAQAAASSSVGPSASTDDLEVLGEMTWAERDAELRSEAVDCDSD
jgi:hypothetical protein